MRKIKEVAMKLAVIGLGYVGLSSAIGFAEKGNGIIGIDKNIEKISELRKGICPIYEPGLSGALKKHLMKGRIIFSSEMQDINKTDIIFIAVGTPSKETGEPDLSFVEAVGKEIAPYINEEQTIVIKSTVPPDTYLKLKEIISSERRKLKLNNVKVDIAVNPEFLREGRALYETLHPERIVIGAETENARNKLLKLYYSFDVPKVVTDPVSAMLIKYASNSFLATKISFINEVAQICERLGGDIEDVVKGMGLDSRIGDKFLRAGIGYGGSCFPKDTKGLLWIAKEVGYDFEIVRSAVNVNEKQYKIVIEKLRKYLGKLSGKTIGLLGLAFKENTDDIRESVAIKIIRELLKEGAKLKAHDPQAINNTKKVFGNIAYFKNPYNMVRGVDAIIIATEWSEYRGLDWKRVKDLMSGTLIIDGRNLLDPEEIRRHYLTYEGVGRRNKQRLKGF